MSTINRDGHGGGFIGIGSSSGSSGKDRGRDRGRDRGGAGAGAMVGRTAMVGKMRAAEEFGQRFPCSEFMFHFREL